MKHLILCALMIAPLACKKKSEDAPAAPAAGSPADKAAEPAKPPANDFTMAPSGIAECDAVPDAYKKFQACAKISDDDHAVQQVNVMQLKDVPSLYTNEKDPDKKDMMKKAAAGQCKDQTDKLHALMTKAGC